jgi:DNA polymerase II large subunit
MLSMTEISKEMEEYFLKIQDDVDHCYEVAEKARQKGLDPEVFVECPQAKDLAGRVEKLVGPEGVANLIRHLKMQGKTDDEIIFQVVSDLLEKKIGNIDSLEERVERAIRLGLAIKTMGVVSAPLEGISKISIREDHLGNTYLSLYFAGPIRAAGGTTAALCVLIADYVRKKSNIPRYQATEAEIGRFVEEVKLYDRRVHLQYPSSNEEIRFAVNNLPVEINGDSTEDEEVSAFRNLPRIETNKIRGGACLVLNDGILLKAPKLLKIAKTMNVEGWGWLNDLKKISQKEDDKQEKATKNQILPNSKYVSDIIAGRPVFSHPSRVGGHRIRYGRSRNTGLAAAGIHPATMTLLDGFIAIGTQLRIERPGKSASICPVSYIEPPIVKLKNEDVIRVNTPSEAKSIFPQIDSILFLGDILFGFGEFAENNHKLVPSGYVEEWWSEELKERIKNNVTSDLIKFIENPFKNIPTAEEAIHLSRVFNIPLHPRYTDHWGNLSINDLHTLNNALSKSFDPKDKKILLRYDQNVKSILEKAFILHRIIDNFITFEEGYDLILAELFSLDKQDSSPIEDVITNPFEFFLKKSNLIVRNKSPYYMGTRMGRPEKSERKSMKGVHTLFPLSEKVGNSRLVDKAIELEKISIDVCRKQCPKCSAITIFNKCPKCGTHTDVKKICDSCKKLYSQNEQKCPNCGQVLKFSSPASINIKHHITNLLKLYNLPLPDRFKGIFGLTNEFKVPEPIEKGLLRAKNDLFVYKTAEIRYDATDIPLTHFKPNEIGTSVETLKALGYSKDYKGAVLVKPTQILELKVQDVILSEDCTEYFLRLTHFIDEELESFYKIEKFYNVETKEDLIGHLVVGLAPHTSAGIIGRIIGFTRARSIYAHPFWHAAKRRNCFPGDTSILVDLNGKIKKIPLKKLYEDYFQGEFFDKTAFFKKEAIDPILVYSFNKNSGKITTTQISNVVKIPFASRLIKFKLTTGRVFNTTLDHPVLVYSKGKVVEKRAIEVLDKDKFILPEMDFEVNDIEKFDLLEEFSNIRFKEIWNDLMIRGIREFVKELIGRQGLKTIAERLGLNKKTLNNYYSKRDSIPLNILLRLLKMYDLSIKDLPECQLGFKRDHTFIKRLIVVDESLMKLFGYYLAEGFYRQIPEGYQVDLAVSEEDLREDMIKSIEHSFGVGFDPYINDYRITISNRVLFHFFKDILKFKNRARYKHIPSILYKLPLEKIKFLLAAYFSGDGGVDLCRKTVNCSSSSLKLIQGIDLLLLRYGIFSAISKSSRNDNDEYKLRIRGMNVLKFKDSINFTSIRKKKGLENIIKNKKTVPEKLYQNHKLIGIRNIEIIQSKEDYVYSLEAAKYHTIIINDNIITHQCDGDEDGIMLLLDPLLNFSRFYLPSKIGGRMDATLVISSKLDPNEIDVEAHNIDTLFRYPLEFYEATQKYAAPNEIENKMNLIKQKLGTPDQYENIGFNIPTKNINEGPIMSAYKTYEKMEEKIDAQLHLAKIIKAVDAKMVAEKILSSHFNPDILGNLRKFAVQEFRCVKCNQKYKRPPLTNGGKCPKCNNNIILTVNRGGIEKYIPRALKLCKEFDLDKYTIQRMELIEQYVESLTNNPKIKQQKLSDFF